MFRSSRRLATLPALGAVLLAVVAAATAAAPPAGAAAYVPISGAGSTWSQNALDQWRRNVTQYGMQINYQGTGSSDGRNQFRNGTVDFAVSEIPYGLTDTGVVDYPPARKYAYMPIVAGGTAFMYNLKINGKRVTNLRLSGLTVARMFTGEIKFWNDPAIAADNPGLRLPARRVVPVVRSDGSGTTAQFTLWMSKLYGAQWNAYCGRAHLPTPCGLTSEYPVIPGSGFTAQAGSLGVSGYVAQDHSEGAITYVEYSYALNASFPIAKLLNRSGYYVEPNANNVAVALLAAQINGDLTQKLDGVYNNADKRAYPLSSYSYMILPTARENGFSTDKGATLGAFAYYFLCEGQQSAPLLGYSPLPINLVQAGLTQVRRIPGVNARNINIAKCNNPTFTTTGKNRLAQIAQFPPACDLKGPTQCVTGTGGAHNTPTANSGNGSGRGNGSGGSGGSGSGGNSPGNGGGSAVAGAGNRTSATGTPSARRTTTIDPDTGQAVTGTDNSQQGGGTEDVVAEPVSVDSGIGNGLERVLMVLAGLLFIGLTVGPPLLSTVFSRRRSS
ncbi:MAG: phosphate transport system substrate-binding protein [Mycobacteriales bacterium]|jgi:phosphate ABC transporter phosphate-binding protein